VVVMVGLKFGRKRIFRRRGESGFKSICLSTTSALTRWLGISSFNYCLSDLRCYVCRASLRVESPHFSNPCSTYLVE
jgi:hypothetical protein